MGQEYPTKEEVETWKYESAHSPLHDHAFENHNRLICIANAYLAQGLELKSEREKARKLHDICVFSEETSCMLLEHGRKLEAENQVIKASMEAEYIEQQAKHIQGLVKENTALKDKLSVYLQKGAEAVASVEAENQALKAELLRLEA